MWRSCPTIMKKVNKYSDHLMTAIAIPILGDIPVTREDREKTLRMQIRRWNHAESTVKEGVVKHLQGHLCDTFQRVATCHEGWTELNKVISYDKESQVDLLEQELSGFAQRANKSDVDYAERFATLLFKLK